MKIKKGDTVKVIAGKDKGKTGRVIEVLRTENRVRVEGVGTIKKHLKAGRSQANAEGGIVERNAAIHASNVMAVDPASGKATRIGFESEAAAGASRAARTSARRSKKRVGRGKVAGAVLDTK